MQSYFGPFNIFSFHGSVTIQGTGNPYGGKGVWIDGDVNGGNAGNIQGIYGENVLITGEFGLVFMLTVDARDSITLRGISATGAPYDVFGGRIGRRHGEDDGSYSAPSVTVQGTGDVYLYDATGSAVTLQATGTLYDSSIVLADTLTTSAAVTTSTAVLGGMPPVDGGNPITARGIVYARTAVNDQPILGGPGVVEIDHPTQTTERFTVPATGLSSGTEYSFTSFVTTSLGTTYSPWASFTTMSASNQAPTDLALGNATLAENAGTNATVGTLTTTDPDAGNTFTYTLVDGAGDNTAFNLAGDVLRANASFDFETRAGYSVVVRTTDQGGLSFDKTFAITVTNVNDVPVAHASSVTTNEDIAKTFTVADFLFTDVEDNGLVSITATNLHLASGDTLKVTQNAGLVNVANGMMITVAQIPSLIYTPAANLSGAARSTFDFKVNDADSGTVAATMKINVGAVADTPSVTNAATTVDTPTTSGLVISRNAADGAEVTHFKITNITNGKLFRNDGVTQILNGAFVTFTQANAGLKLTPNANFVGDGTFQVQASVSATDAGLGGSSVTAKVIVAQKVTVTQTVSVVATRSTATEGSATTGQFKVSVPQNVSTSTTVSFTVAGTATAADGVPVSRSVTIPVGANSATFDVAAIADHLHEGSETVLLTLTNTDNVFAVVGNPKQATVTILDIDPVPTISIKDLSVIEGSTAIANFTVTLNVANSTAVTVKFKTKAGTATAGADYTETTGTLTIPANATSATIPIPILNDNIYEGVEKFTIELSAPTNAVLGTLKTATATINDDETQPLLQITSAVTVREGAQNGGVIATFTVSLTGASTLPISVDYATADVTAKGTPQVQTTGFDYRARQGTLLWNAFDARPKTVSVIVFGDVVYENTETFQVNLSKAVNVMLGSGAGNSLCVVTILDDDTVPTISTKNISVNEGTGSGTTTAASFTVSLSNPSAFTTTVKYATANGTAMSGLDYTQIPATTLTFAPGETSKMIPVTINRDALNENNETFLLNLSNAVGGTISTPNATGTILDDDVPPNLSIGNAAAIKEGGHLLFPVTLSKASGKAITVQYATSNGTAGAADYTTTAGTLTFAPGSLKPTAGGNVDANGNIKVPALSDAIQEKDETLSVNLKSPTNATLATTSGTGTIQDNSPKPQLSINSVFQKEGHSGTTNMVFTVTLSVPSAFPVTVTFTSVAGSATAGTDFVVKSSGTLTFNAGVTAQTITIQIKGDTALEGDEAFTVKLSSPTNATISTSVGTGIIQNDD